MATPIELLQLSPTMSEGTIVKWLKKEGESISAGDILAEIETDKAVMEQEAFDDATLLKILVPEGSAVPVGGRIAIVGNEGEDISALLGNGSAAPAKKAEPKAEPAPAPAASESEPIVKTGGPPKVNLRAEQPPADKESNHLANLKKEAPVSTGGRIVASPLARKMAADQGLDLAAIQGTGPGGRIIKRDIESALEGGVSAPATTASAAPIAVTPAAGDQEIPVSGMRKVIARRLVQSRQEVPAFGLNVDVNAEALLAAVARVREINPDAKVTVTHFLIKAMACTLMNHPWMRTQWVNGKMIRKASAHISVAVAVEDGLLTPVLRDAQSKGLYAIAAELRELAGKARDRKLGEADLSGGVQTISNLGMFGIDNFDAIINPPEAAILAVGAVIDKPVVRGGEIVPGKIITLNLSCDHRVVDGAVGASYLKDLKAALEDPLLMLV